MSQASTPHRRARSEPEPRAADLEPTTQCLFSLVQTIRHVANHESFKNLEATSQEIALLKQRDQTYEKKVGQLEAQLEGLKASNDARIKERDTQHNLARHELLKTHREVVAKEEHEKKVAKQELSAAQATIKAKEKEVLELGNACSETKIRVKDYSSQKKQAEERLAQTKKEVEMLLGKVGDKEATIQKQKQKLADQDKKIESYESTIGSLNNKIETLEGDLHNRTKDLTTLNAFALPLQEDNVDQMINQFNGLWQRCINAVHSCFETDLRQSVLQDASAWIDLRSSDDVHRQVPLPRSNSIPAKAIRCIVVLTLISRLLVDDIFKTTYLVGRDVDLRQELYLLAPDNPSKEAFTRALLGSLHDQDYLDNHINLVVQKAYKLVKELLEPSLAEGFRAHLQSIFNEGASIWRNLQASKTHYEVDLLTQGEESWSWKSIKLPNTTLAFEERDVTTNDFHVDVVELNVFPRVFIVGSTADIPVVPGRVFQQSQTAAVKQEVERMEENISPLRSSTAKIERRRTTLRRLSQPEQPGGAFLGSGAGQQRS